MATLYFNAAVNGDWAELGNWWTDDTFTTQASALPTSSDNVVLSATCNSNSGSEPTVVDLTFNDPTYDGGHLYIAVTVTGNATFNVSSYNYGTVTGNATFNDNSRNDFGTVSGDATFNDNSRNDFGGVNGNATFTASSYTGSPTGTVSGTVTFSSASPVSFTVNSDVFGVWSQDTSSWVFSTEGQNWTFNFNSSLNYSVTITGNATFNDYSANGGIVNGNATFNNSYNNTTVTGNATFNGSSVNISGTVTGNATFSPTSASAQIAGGFSGTYGSVSLAYEKGINGSSILGVV